MRCPGLVVMGEVVGFESRCHILDGHDNFFTLICCKKLNCLFEKAKIKRKEAGVGPFKTNNVNVFFKPSFATTSVDQFV